MNPTLRNILAFIASLIIGSIINYGTIIIGSGFLPVPEGVDPMDIETIKANANLYTVKHWILPFLAHALGTLSAAYAVCRLATSHFKSLALGIAGVFVLGGIMMAVGLPELISFAIVDILFAYFPMALLGWKLAGSPK